MITFTCPSCNGKCQVGDEMSGRKMKCPKCGTRIRHHQDGTIELLTLNAAPLPAPGAPPAAAEAPALKESTAVLAHVADKLLSQDEGKQNVVVTWALVGFLAVALAAGGLIYGSAPLAVAPIALAFAAGFVWLALRKKRRETRQQQRDEAKTEAIPKP